MELPNLSEELLKKASSIKLVIMDVDGVLSNGNVYYSNQGDEIKSFNIKDGLGIKLLHKVGIKTAIITGRKSELVKRRANELGVSIVFQGKSDKRAAFSEILTLESLKAEDVAHIGDDLPDLPIMRKCGLGVAVADAHWFVQKHADWVTPKNGGDGAVRALAELILTAQNKLEQSLSSYLQP